MAKTNKAERTVQRLMKDSFYYGLSDEEALKTDVYFKVCTHLGNPDHWPAEYNKAYREAFNI